MADDQPRASFLVARRLTTVQPDVNWSRNCSTYTSAFRRFDRGLDGEPCVGAGAEVGPLGFDYEPCHGMGGAKPIEATAGRVHPATATSAEHAGYRSGYVFVLWRNCRDLERFREPHNHLVDNGNVCRVRVARPADHRRVFRNPTRNV